MHLLLRFFLIWIFFVFSGVLHADMQRGINNYKAIISGQKTIEQLSDEEAEEVISVVKAIKSRTAGGQCSAVIEGQIDGEFEGWDGDTVFKLTNGQIWQQSSYSYRYHYAYRPKVLIYSGRGGCKLKVEGISDPISVNRLK
tara:strand:+ start:51 stop:473 length:423 start_codon:yes stop_codon:yes gene_type:complete